MLPIVECLKYSPLVNALTKVEQVQMSLMSKAYSTTIYVKEEERIAFEVLDKNTSLTKALFCSLLGLNHDDSMVNPDLISTAQVFDMFYQMGYTDPIPSITKFKKSNLPPLWNGLFTLLFKAFSERIIGSDCVSNSMSILYGLYHGINSDYGLVLWAQLVQRTNSTTRHNEIYMVRFWTIVVQRAIVKLKIPVMSDSLMSSIVTFHTTKSSFLTT